MKDKLALVLSGGGMFSSSYMSGALLALVEKHNLTSPDIAIGGSGSAAVLSYYVSGQYNYIREFIGSINIKKLINPFRLWKILDLDYMINEVIKKQFPLDMESLYSSKTNLLIGATNTKTGDVRHFSSKNRDDMIQALRATKSMPFFCRPVRIDGSYYGDSYASCSTKMNFLKAVDMGATKVIVITKGGSGKFWKQGFKLWFSTKSRRFRENYSRIMEREKNLSIPKNVKLIVLKPDEKINLPNLSRDVKRLNLAMQQGYDFIAGSVKLKNFLSER